MHPIDPSERTECSGLLTRLGLAGSLSAGLRAALDPATTLPASLPERLARPVTVAAPGDALRAAADAVFEKGWTSRLAFLSLQDAPVAAAGRFLARADDLYTAESLTVESRTKGVGAFAMTTLGLPEGPDEGPAFGEYLTAVRSGLRRREMSAGLFRTAGSIGSPEYPAGAVVGAPTDPDSPVRADRARVVGMRAGITDVGMLAVALYPTPSAKVRGSRVA